MKFCTFATSAFFATIPSLTTAEVLFKEQFNDDSWSERWTVPTEWRSESEIGKWVRSAGENYFDIADTGLQTSEDARFYGLSAKLDKAFNSSEKKDVVIQYSVKHEQGIDCGGAYIKLLPGGDDFDPIKFGGDSPYGIMFGPDICGSTKRTHVILHSETKKDNLLIKKDVPCEKDTLSHLYTLVLKSDNTFDVLVDNKSVRSGKLEDEFDFLEPKEIKDPDESKPDDWVDEKKIPDPEDIKPEGYDDIPAEIPEPDAVQPEDWDEEDDGEWEPPMVDNPDYKGPWSPEMIDNPAYKGPWVHPMIPNPDYKYDENMHAVCPDGCTHVGFELWQVKSGTIFDDIIITDSLEEAQKFGEETFFKKKDGEKEMFDKKREEELAQMPVDDDDEDYAPTEDFEGFDEL